MYCCGAYFILIFFRWRIAESDYDSLFDKNTTVEDPSQDSDVRILLIFISSFIIHHNITTQNSLDYLSTSDLNYSK